MSVTVEQLEITSSRSVPAWVRMLDGTALVLLFVAVLLIPGDGMRFTVGSVRVAVSSAVRVAVWAAIVIAARHAFYRRPALPARVVSWLRADVQWAEIRFAARLFLTTRLTPILIGLLAVAAIGIAKPVGNQPYDSPWLNLPARWDAIWYAEIAAFGYRWNGDPLQQQSVVFFPGFPLAIQLVSRFMGAQVFYAAWFVSLAAFAGAVPLFVRLARRFLDDRAAADSAWLLATYPFAIYFSAAYSEGLFLLTICGAFLAMHERKFGRAAAWGLAAGLTRPNGWLLALPLMVLAFHRQTLPSTAREWLRRGAAVAAPIVGMLLFSLYLYLQFGDGLIWLRGQAAWGRLYRGLHLFAADRLTYVRDAGLVQYLLDQPFDALNTCAALLALGLVVPISRRLGIAYGALVAVMVLPPLLMGGATSMGRMTSVLFPMFIWLAATLPERHRTSAMVIFATLQGFAATLFFTWRELY
jgi:hypothetical protein